MALFKYLTKEKDKLVEGEEFVKANELVEEINESRGGSPTPSKRGTYKICSPKQRYEIGQYTFEHGNARVSRKFNPMFDKKISESTVLNRFIRNHYAPHFQITNSYHVKELSFLQLLLLLQNSQLRQNHGQI
jgi:hypothetical protein